MHDEAGRRTADAHALDFAPQVGACLIEKQLASHVYRRNGLLPYKRDASLFAADAHGDFVLIAHDEMVVHHEAQVLGEIEERERGGVHGVALSIVILR
jgi:hypothetical protein